MELESIKQQLRQSLDGLSLQEFIASMEQSGSFVALNRAELMGWPDGNTSNGPFYAAYAFFEFSR